MKRRSAIIAVFVLMMLVLTGCRYSDPYRIGFYDDNARIAQQGDSYSFTDRLGRTVANELDLTFTSFTGKQTIWLIPAGQDCVLELNVVNEITEGKFKVCLIDPNRQVSVISEGSQTGTIDLNIAKGENVLTIIGSKASGTIDMTLRYDPRASIIPYEHLLR